VGRVAGGGSRRSTDTRVRRVLVAALLVHLAASGLHGLTHGLVPVDLAPWQDAVVVTTTFVGPVAGVALALRGRRIGPRGSELGLAVFTASMAGALAFGAYFHFLVWNPDHVHAVPADPWRVPFQASAVAVALANALGVGSGVWALTRDASAGR